MEIRGAVRAAIDPIAPVVTIDPSGTPHISLAWIGLVHIVLDLVSGSDEALPRH
jgi:hypothetical protein